jgi:hypothetical protein
MYARYLEVHRDANEGVVIKPLQNPKRMSTLIETAFTGNMLCIWTNADDFHERIAWDRTIRIAA